MKEILYLQLGNYSNYVGTHFWNTQDDYRNVELEEDNPVNDQVSFVERQNADGTSTMYPRVLLFDWKANFGTLGRSNALNEGTEESPNPLIDYSDQCVDEYRQTPITKSAYHKQLEAPVIETQNKTSPEAQSLDSIRYWSDFSHLYYLPRSIQRVPTVSPWDSSEGSWKQSQDQFESYNEEHELVDSSLRLFLEESDGIKGMQIMTDVSSFGGFTDRLLVKIQDDYMKTPTVVFPFLSKYPLKDLDIDNHGDISEIVNQALCIRNLQEYMSVTVPVNLPSLWPSSAWNAVTQKTTYSSSSVISALIESITLSFRAKRTSDDIQQLAQLFSGGMPPYAELSGIIPVGSSTDFLKDLVNFSCTRNSEHNTAFSIRDVIRGFSSLENDRYHEWLKSHELNLSGLQQTSFPVSHPLHLVLHPEVSAQTCQLARLSTGTGLAHTFGDYADFISKRQRRRAPGIMTIMPDIDDIQELVNDLWTIHDRYPSVDDNQLSENISHDEQ